MVSFLGGGVRVWKVVFRCWGFMVFSLSLSSSTSPTSLHVWLVLAGMVLMGELGNEAVVFSCQPSHHPVLLFKLRLLLSPGGGVDEWATKVPSPRLCQPAVLLRYGISPDPPLCQHLPWLLCCLSRSVTRCWCNVLPLVLHSLF